VWRGRRVVIFDSVDGTGTNPSRLSRQKIRHEIESPTSRHNDSYPSLYWNFKNYADLPVMPTPARAV